MRCNLTVIPRLPGARDQACPRSHSDQSNISMCLLKLRWASNRAAKSTSLRPWVTSALKFCRSLMVHMQAAAAGPSRMAALTLTLGAHLLDLDRVPLSISALTLSHAFVPLEALVALVARHLAFQVQSSAFA